MNDRELRIRLVAATNELDAVTQEAARALNEHRDASLYRFIRIQRGLVREIIQLREELACRRIERPFSLN